MKRYDWRTVLVWCTPDRPPHDEVHMFDLWVHYDGSEWTVKIYGHGMVWYRVIGYHTKEEAEKALGFKIPGDNQWSIT